MRTSLLGALVLVFVAALVGNCGQMTRAAAATTDDSSAPAQRTEIQFRSGATWGPTTMPHLLFQTAIWAGFFAAMVPDNGLIDFVTGRFRHRTRRYLELSGGVVAANLVGRVDLLMKIALMQVAASFLPYRPGGTTAPMTFAPPSPFINSTMTYNSSSSNSSADGYLHSTSSDYFAPGVTNANGEPATVIQLTPNYLFFLTQAPMVYFLLKAGDTFKINDYYTAVMISATGIYSNVGFLLCLLLGQLAVKLVFSALLNRNVNTSMASAYLHVLSIITVPMAMHGAFYFTQEELLTLSQKPTNHTIIVGITLAVFVVGLLGTLLSNGVSSAIHSSRRVLSWWASEVSPIEGERLHWAWLVSMWLFSSIAGMIGGNWIGAIFDGRPPSEQVVFNYGSAALYFLSAVCNSGAVILIPESRKLSVTAVLSDLFLCVFSFPQIDPNVVGAVMAVLLFVWAIRALIVHLILPFIDSRTQIPIPEAHSQALRDNAVALLGSDRDGTGDGSSDDDGDEEDQSGEVRPSPGSGRGSGTLSVQVDDDFDDGVPAGNSPAPSAVSASVGQHIPKLVPPARQGPVTTTIVTTGCFQPPATPGAVSTSGVIDPFDNLSDDDEGPPLNRSTSRSSVFSTSRSSNPRSSTQPSPRSIELTDMTEKLPGRGRVVGVNNSPPPAWIRHLPAPNVEIQVHKRRTSILRTPFHSPSGSSFQNTQLLPTPVESPRSFSLSNSAQTTPRGSLCLSPAFGGGPVSLRDSFSLPPRQSRSPRSLGLSPPSQPGSGSFEFPPKKRGVTFRKADIDDPTKYGSLKKGRKSKPAFPVDYLSASADSPPTAGGGATPSPGLTSPVLHSAGGGNAALTPITSPALTPKSSFRGSPQAIQLNSRPVFPIESQQPAVAGGASSHSLGLAGLNQNQLHINISSTSPDPQPGKFRSGSLPVSGPGFASPMGAHNSPTGTATPTQFSNTVTPSGSPASRQRSASFTSVQSASPPPNRRNTADFTL